MKSCTEIATKKTQTSRITSIAVSALVILCLSMTLIASAMAATTSQYSTDNYAFINAALVGTTPSPAIAGELLEVRIGFQNQGGQDTKDITAQFVPSYPFTLVAGNNATQSVGTLQAYQGSFGSENSRTIKYTVLVDKNAPAGTYDFTFNYGEAGADPVEVKLPVEIKTANNAQTITIDKTSLSPGKPTNVTFTISNVGNAPLRNLVFTWSNSANSILPVGSDNTRYIKYIDAGESIDLPFTVVADTNADAGLYKLDLTLSYENALNSSITKLTTTTAGMYVGGGTDFDVAYSESSSGQISLSVANVGNNPASSVSVIVPPQSGWRVSGSNTAIVGNLNKGDYTAVSFSITQNSGAGLAAMQNAQANGQTGAYNASQAAARARTRSANGTATTTPAASGASNNMLLVDIAYTDTAGQRETVEKQVQISSTTLGGNTTASGFAGRTAVTAKASFWSTYKWYIIGIIVIVGGLFWYRRNKKKQMLNEINDSDADNMTASMNGSKSNTKRK